MASASMDDDDLKTDGKKRKFKPLEAMRKLFGKGKRKSRDESVSVVAVKAKSTTALHHNDDNEDDGGFKDRSRRLRGDNRSISEDSIFTPVEQRETNLQALKKTAVSEENLSKSAFQAELLSKLHKRRSQYSDEDDGLPHSPTPPLTTADILEGPLKPLPAAGKSMSRESDNSLISMDGSENEEEDPFQSAWRSSNPVKMSSDSKMSDADGPIDFDKMGQIELLKSDLAKDKLNVKPRARKATRQSRKMRDGQSPPSLPSLNEESPPKLRHEENLPSSVSDMANPVKDDVEEVTLRADKTDEMPAERPSSTDFNQQSLVRNSSDSSPTPLEKLQSVPKTVTCVVNASITEAEPMVVELKETGVRVDVAPPSQLGSVSKLLFDDQKPEIASIDQKPEIVNISSSKIIFPKSVELVGKSSDSEVLGDDSSSGLISSSVAEGRHTAAVTTKLRSSIHVTPKIDAPSEAKASSAKPKAEFLSSKLLGGQKSDMSIRQSGVELTTTSIVTIISTSVNTSAMTGSTPLTVSSSSSTTSASKPLESTKQTDTQVSLAPSPKDDYKQRRQSRSRTLPEQPVSKDEQLSATVQRAASHREETSSSQNASPRSSPKLKAKQIQKETEPEWFAMARKKTGRQESEKKSDSPTSETASVKELTAATAPEVTLAVTSASLVYRTETEPKPVHTESTVSLAAASESKSSEGWHSRGGSVKSSPTKTNILSNRGGSIKLLSTRSETGSRASSTIIIPSVLKPTTTTAASLASLPVKAEEPKEESKTEEVSDAKRKTSTAATTIALISSSVPATATVTTSRFSGLKTSSQSVSVSKAEDVKEEKKTEEVSAARWKTPTFVSSSTPVTATVTTSRFSGIKTSAQSVPASKGEDVKEETKTEEIPPAKDIPKWKTPATTVSTAGSFSTTSTTSAASTSRFTGMKTASQSVPVVVSKADFKPHSPVKVASGTKASEEKATVPAWRANLIQKKPQQASEIKIELIESSSSGTPVTSASGLKKEEGPKQEEPSAKATTASRDLQVDQCRGSATSNRNSKVMNLMKNFENLQGVS